MAIESRMYVLSRYFCTPSQIVATMSISHVLYFIAILKPHGNQLKRNKTKKAKYWTKASGMQQVPCLDLCLEKPIHMSEGDENVHRPQNL